MTLVQDGSGGGGGEDQPPAKSSEGANAGANAGATTHAKRARVPDAPTPASAEPGAVADRLLYDYDMSLHAENRARLVAAMRAAPLVDARAGVVLLEGGKSRTRDDTDHEELFRQESFFVWAFGVKEPDAYGSIDLGTGASTLYIPTLPPSYAVFMGEIRTPESFRKEYGVDRVEFVESLPTALAGRTLYTLRDKNHDSGEYAREASFPGIEAFRVDNGALHPVMTELRAIKTAKEIKLMAHINRVSCEAHAWVMRRTRPGMREFQQEALFQHFGYYFGQCRHTSYTSICGSGANCAILHYGHAGAPNDKTVADGDMCLLDMGAEYRCYGSDITCTFPANGRFTPEQRVVYEAVLEAQWEVMKRLRPGVDYVSMQALAYDVICRALRDRAGILVGDPDEIRRANMGAVFMPHGLGHMLGIDTHDVGGKPRGAPALLQDGFNRLRLVRALQEGMIITVEPGIYFNAYTIDRALANPDQAKFIDRDALARYRYVGGVRLEDDVLITRDGIRNLTRVPRTVADVEAWIAGTVDDLNALECPWSDKF